MEITCLFWFKKPANWILQIFTIFVLLAIISSSSGCNNKSGIQDHIIIKAYPYNLDEKTYPNIKLQNIVQLETTDSSIFGEVIKLQTSKEHFFIFDEWVSKSIYCFYKNGEYCFKTKIGNGPGELVHPTDFLIDSIASELCIFDGSRYMYYKLNGSFIRSEAISPYHFIQKAEALKNDELFIFNGNPPPSILMATQKDKINNIKDSSYYCIIVNKKIDKEIGRFFPITYNNARLMPENPVTIFNGILYCVEGGWSNIINKYTKEDQFEPVYEIDFSEKNITKNDWKKPWQEAIQLTEKGNKMGMIQGLFITDKFVVFSYLCNDESSPCIYSIENNQAYSLPKILEYNGLPRAKPVKFLSNDVLLCAVYIDDYLDYLDQHKNIKSPKINLKVNRRDNPILIEIKIE